MMFSHPRCGAPPDRGNERFGRGCVAIGGKVKLVDETSENAQADVPMYIRYYRRTGIPDTLDKRRSSLVGYVETEAQRIFLARHGCAAYPSFLISQPLPPDQFRE